MPVNKAGIEKEAAAGAAAALEALPTIEFAGLAFLLASRFIIAANT